MYLVRNLEGIFHVMDTLNGQPCELGLLLRNSAGTWVYIHHLLPSLKGKSLEDLREQISQLTIEHPEITEEGLVLDDPTDCVCADIVIPLAAKAPQLPLIESYAHLFV